MKQTHSLNFLDEEEWTERNAHISHFNRLGVSIICCGNSQAEPERMLKPASSPSLSKTFQSYFLGHLLAPGLEGSRPLVISEGQRP